MKDPYIQDNGVLVNKLNIQDAETLKQREAEITYVKLTTVDMIEGNFDYEHLKKMHQHIFGDVYEFAGSERTVPVEKSEKILNGMSVQYTPPKDIKTQATKAIKNLHSVKWRELPIDQQAQLLAKNTAALWQVHPFREGNTRTTINFITNFAHEYDMPMDKALLKKHAAYVRDALVMSSIGEYSETKHLERIFKDSLQRGQALRLEEISYAPEPAKLNSLSDKKTLYDAYAKQFLENGKLAIDCDKSIIGNMAKDGHNKESILAALQHSPHFGRLDKTDKMLQARKVFQEVAKQPELKKLLSRDLS